MPELHSDLYCRRPRMHILLLSVWPLQCVLPLVTRMSGHCGHDTSQQGGGANEQVECTPIIAGAQNMRGAESCSLSFSQHKDVSSLIIDWAVSVQSCCYL